MYEQNNIPYGTIPTYGGETPTSTKGEDYAFDGWDPPLAPIHSNTTYNTVFKYVGSITRLYLKGDITSIDNNVATSIGPKAFSGCSKLTDI